MTIGDAFRETFTYLERNTNDVTSNYEVIHFGYVDQEDLNQVIICITIVTHPREKGDW